MSFPAFMVPKCMVHQKHVKVSSIRYHSDIQSKQTRKLLSPNYFRLFQTCNTSKLYSETLVPLKFLRKMIRVPPPVDQSESVSTLTLTELTGTADRPPSFHSTGSPFGSHGSEYSITFARKAYSITGAGKPCGTDQSECGNPKRRYFTPV